MFDRISNGFSMAKSSWRVIMNDKKLLWFPVVSGILFVLVSASFLVPLGILFDQNKLLDANGSPRIWCYAILFAFYFATYFVIIFCNAALVSCTLLHFNGENPTLGDGFRTAMARLPQILAWALVSASVGLLLKAIESVHEKLGEILSSLLGSAWSIMTYFVVPILVVEKVGPFEAVSRSVKLMKQTWGEALAGKIGMGLFLFLLAIPIILLLVLGGVLVAQPQMQAVGIALLVVGGLAMLWYMAVSSAMSTVLATAVYQFASSDRIPDGFDRESIARAFQGRKRN